MLIKPESQLRCISTDINTRDILFLDGVRYSIEIIDLNYKRLLNTIEQIVILGNEKKPIPPFIAMAMSDSWAIIDSTHRLRELIQSLPKLKKNTPEVQVFLRNTQCVEDLRNYVQHFRTGINSFVKHEMPLWGTLIWNKKNAETGCSECHSIIPGTFFNNITSSIGSFSNEKYEFYEKIILKTGEFNCDIADIYDRVSVFFSWYENWFIKNFSDENHHGADAYVKFQIKPNIDNT